MEALKVDGLSKNFGGAEILMNLSFSVEVGEHLAIIGPNGAGKTTLLNILSGQLSPTTGKVYLFGQDITKVPIYRRTHLGLARSFQISSLFLNLTVLDSVLLALQGTKPSRFQMFHSITSYDEILNKARELLEVIDLWERRNDLVRNLAYGEQRRLEIRLAVASEPKLLLLDEPGSGLTVAERVDIAEMIRRLRADITVIIVAHDMDLVFDVADRIMVLNFGQIIALGTTQEIQAEPRVREIYLGERGE